MNGRVEDNDETNTEKARDRTVSEEWDISGFRVSSAKTIVADDFLLVSSR